LVSRNPDIGSNGASATEKPALLRAMFDVVYFPPNTPPIE
jgi:hypothetical protein